MLVDDETDITETQSLYLEFFGFDVVTANSASEALNKMSARLPDLIISDCMMPEIDGVEFSRRLRERTDTRAIPIILTSGAPYFHDLRSPTYDLFLLKPVVMTRLTEEIRRLLAAASQAHGDMKPA